MSWSVRFLKSAERSFLDLPEKFRLQIAKNIAALEENPFPPGSEKMAGLRAALALHFAWYKFVRVHRTPRVTPALEAKITDHVWDLAELIC